MEEETKGLNGPEPERKGPDGPAPEEGEPTSPPAQTTEGAQELKKKLDEALASAEAFKDQLLRKAAEFENYKRRNETEFRTIIRNANESLILSLIPVLDDLVRSLSHGKESKDYDAFYKGIELIYAKLSKVLEQQGLAPFESVGRPFDVEYHDALLQVPKGDVPPHTVIEEIERGYKLYDKVLRHAKVIVSSAPELREPIPTDGEDKKSDDN